MLSNTSAPTTDAPPSATTTANSEAINKLTRLLQSELQSSPVYWEFKNLLSKQLAQAKNHGGADVEVTGTAGVSEEKLWNALLGVEKGLRMDGMVTSWIERQILSGKIKVTATKPASHHPPTDPTTSNSSINQQFTQSIDSAKTLFEKQMQTRLGKLVEEWKVPLIQKRDPNAPPSTMTAVKNPLSTSPTPSDANSDIISATASTSSSNSSSPTPSDPGDTPRNWSATNSKKFKRTKIGLPARPGYFDADHRPTLFDYSNGGNVLYGAWETLEVGKKKFLYDAEDVWGALRKLKDPVMAASSGNNAASNGFFGLDKEFVKTWTAIPMFAELVTPSLEELKVVFKELHPKYQQIGVDDVYDVTRGQTFLNNYTNIGRQVLDAKSVFAARQYAKFGVPQVIRGQIWELVLNSSLLVETSESNTDGKSKQQQQQSLSAQNSAQYVSFVKSYCEQLRANNSILLTDYLLRNDANQSQNDDSYFVFGDALKEMMFLWTRDDWLKKHVRTGFSSSITSTDKGKPMTFPPNGILPFWGTSCYALPVCFLFEDSDLGYFVFREMYARYFCYLHNLPTSAQLANSNSRLYTQPLDPRNPAPTLPYLLRTFETLLLSSFPDIYHHFHNTLHASPTQFVYKWIMYAFVGVLDIEQVLLLWDRVLGFGRLEILPLLCVAILGFRKNELLETRLYSELDDVFGDLQEVRVMPLLQYLLFGRE